MATALLLAAGALVGAGGPAGAASTALSPGTYEEGSASFGAGWQQGCGQGQSGGCDRWSSTPGSSYQIGFRGTGIVIFGAKAFNGG